MSEPTLPALRPHAAADSVAPLQPADPRRNPAYPRRTHTNEGPRWRGVLQAWDARIAAAAAKLPVTADPDSMGYLYAQMLGARDQIAQAAGRLPQEVGDGYEEDHHLMELAIAALERVFRRWDAVFEA